jgi:hypothetical protein
MESEDRSSERIKLAADAVHTDERLKNEIYFIVALIAMSFSVVRKKRVRSEIAGVDKEIPPSLFVARMENFLSAGRTKTSPCSLVK